MMAGIYLSYKQWQTYQKICKTAKNKHSRKTKENMDLGCKRLKNREKIKQEQKTRNRNVRRKSTEEKTVNSSQFSQP